jgi:hypothetical protein
MDILHPTIGFGILIGSDTSTKINWARDSASTAQENASKETRLIGVANNISSSGILGPLSKNWFFRKLRGSEFAELGQACRS